MAPSTHSSNHVAQARRDGVLFGIPLGELGWFQTVLMSLATGFAAFFAATFCAIITLLIYLMATGRHPDFALTYKRVGFPVGVVVLVAVSLYLGSLWVRRKTKSRTAH